MSDVLSALIERLVKLEAEVARLKAQELNLPAGAASAPAVTLAGDTNTGIYHSAEDNLDFSTGGTNRLNISSTGIAVGTDDTDSGLLRLFGNGANNTEGGEIQLFMAADHDSTYDFWFIDAYNDSLRFGPKGQVRVTFASDGAVVFGNSDSYPIRMPFLKRIYPTRSTHYTALDTGFTATSFTSFGNTITSGRHFFENSMPSVPSGHQRRWYLSVSWSDSCTDATGNCQLRLVRVSDGAVMAGPWELSHRWASVDYNYHCLLGPFYNADTGHWRLQYKVPVSNKTFWPWEISALVVLETT
mgnify:FL=1